MATEVLDLLWIVFFVLLSLFAHFLSKSLYGDSVSPLSVYVGVNSISMCLYHLKLLRYHEVSIEVHAILIISILVFFIAAYMNSNAFHFERLRHKRLFSRRIGIARFFYITAGLSTVGWIIALAILVHTHGLFYLIRNPWILQLEFQMQFIGYLNLIGIIVLPTFVIKGSGGKKKLVDIILVISALFGLVLAGIKSYLVCSIVVSCFAYSLFNSQRLRTVHLLSAIISIIAFFVIYDRIIDVFSVSKFSEPLFPEWLIPLEKPYLYLSGSWPAMENIVAGIMPEQPIFGYVTMQPLWKVLGDGLNIIEPLPPYLPSVCIGDGLFFNVFSFVGEVYWDYGLPGVIVFSFLLGDLSTRLYIRAKEGIFWGFVLFCSLFMYGMFISFFMYRYRFNFMFLLMYVYLFAFVPVRIRGYCISYGTSS